MRIAGLILVALLAGCSDSDPAEPSDPPQGTVVQATPAITFNPAQIQIGVNEEVTWDFQTVAHNVFFEDTPGRPSDISGLNSNSMVTRQFTAPGTFDYECRIHPGMRGSVIVEAEGAAGTSGYDL